MTDQGRVRVRLGIGLGLGSRVFFRGDFFLEPSEMLYSLEKMKVLFISFSYVII